MRLLASRFVPRHEDELHLEIDDPLLILDQSEDLWCRGYNMRSGSTGIFPAFYTVEVAKEPGPGRTRRLWRLEGPSRVSSEVSLLSSSPEGQLDRAVPGALPGLGAGPRPQGQRRALCCHAEGRCTQLDGALLDLLDAGSGLFCALEPASRPKRVILVVAPVCVSRWWVTGSRPASLRPPVCWRSA